MSTAEEQTAELVAVLKQVSARLETILRRQSDGCSENHIEGMIQTHPDLCAARLVLRKIEEAEDEPWFLNHYRCDRCKIDWSNNDDCTCNDRCPQCNDETEPFESEDA